MKSLGILLLSGSHERAHYALMLATGAAALGRRVVLLASNDGTRALLADWSGLADAGRDAAIQAAGVAGFDTLRDAAVELGVSLLACDSGLRMAGLQAMPLMAGVQVAGIASFLVEAADGQLLTL